MNVIMPIAMTTMHQNDNLSNQSKQTAKRGIQVLKSLKEIDPSNVQKNCDAILAVAATTDPTTTIQADLSDSDGSSERKMIEVRGAY